MRRCQDYGHYTLVYLRLKRKMRKESSPSPDGRFHSCGSVAPPGFIWKELHRLPYELGMCLLPDTHSPRSTPPPASLLHSAPGTQSLCSIGKGSSHEISLISPWPRVSTASGSQQLWSRTWIPLTSPPGSDLVLSVILRCRISASALPVTTGHGNPLSNQGAS